MEIVKKEILLPVLGVATVVLSALCIESTSFSILIAGALSTILFLRSYKSTAPILESAFPLSLISAALIYSVLGALVIVYIRSAQGFILPMEPLPPLLSNIPPAYYANDNTLTVYNKSHIRSAFFQFIFYLILLCALLLTFFARPRLDKLVWLSNPWLASAVFVTACSVIPVPPFSMDPSHWSHLIGPTLGIGQGKLPVLDVFSYYGFIPPIILSIWGDLFDITPISLALLLSSMAAGASLMIYTVVAKLGRSHLAAFLTVAILMLMAYDQQKWAIVVPNHSALRFHFFIAASMMAAYKLFHFYSINSRQAGIYAFAIGILTLWSLLEGAFVLFSITFAMAVEALLGTHESRLRILRLYLTYISGIVFVAIIALIISAGHISGVVDSLAMAIDFFSIFKNGYGYLPQAMRPEQLVWWAMIGLVGVFTIRRIALKEQFDSVRPFCIFVLILSIPYVLQEIGRGAVQPNGIWWLYLPCVAILLSRTKEPHDFVNPFSIFVLIFTIPYVVQEISFGSIQLNAIWWLFLPSVVILLSKTLVVHPLNTGAIILAAVALIIVGSVGNPAEIFAKRIGLLTVSREPDIFNWAKRCDVAIAKGESCDSPIPFSLNGKFINELKWQFATDPIFKRMVTECKSGSLIVDTRDAFVYALGMCSPQSRYQSFFSVSSNRQSKEYLEVLSGGRPVFFGNAGGFAFQQRLLDQIKQDWMAKRLAPTDCNPAKSNAKEFALSALSDGTYSRGISLPSAKSVLLDTDRDILCHLSLGMKLHFAGSGERKITKIVGNIIEVDGSSLDTMSDGYPNQIEIVRN